MNYCVKFQDTFGRKLAYKSTALSRCIENYAFDGYVETWIRVERSVGLKRLTRRQYQLALHGTPKQRKKWRSIWCRRYRMDKRRTP